MRNVFDLNQTGNGPDRGTAVWRNFGRLTARNLLFAAFALGAFAIGGARANAQDLEPRSYTNTPVGLNFLLAGYVYSSGRMAFDPSLAIVDASFRSHSGALAYVRSLDVFGNSAKIDVVVPYTGFSAHALVDDQIRVREMAGLNDPRFRFSMNFLGAPALSVKEFATYRQDLIVGGSIQVSVPLGQYDQTKLLNLGNNRWSFKPELGISKAWGSWTFEAVSSVTFFTDNPDFYNGSRLVQAPIYVMQTHILYSFQSGVWVGLGGTYFTGGRTSLNGVKADNAQANTRAGLTLALPVDRHNSLKLYASTGTSTRTGSEFRAAGVAWQYRWGDDY